MRNHAEFSIVFLEHPKVKAFPDQRSRLKNKASMLDYLLEDTSKLARKLGNYDKRKLDEYLTSIREVEQQVDRTEAWLEVAKPHVDPMNVNLMAGTDDPAEFIRTIYDLMVLAFQTDSTRVATYQIAREDSQGVGDKFRRQLGLVDTMAFPMEREKKMAMKSGDSMTNSCHNNSAIFSAN